jgi:hypothetical protein
MRHLGSFFLALIMAPLIWILTGIGASKFAEARAASANFNQDLAIALAAVLGAGLCYSLLVLTRLSPIGPVLVGLAFLGATGWRVVNLASFQTRPPGKFLGVASALQWPAEGYAALLAVPLVITMFSARRWRRYDGVDAQPGYSTPMAPSYPAPAASPPVSSAPSYRYTDTSTPPYPTTPVYPGTGYPTTPGYSSTAGHLPTAGYPPPPSQPPAPYQASHGSNIEDTAWLLPEDPDATRRL